MRLSTEHVLLTPKLAQKLLEMNTLNRPISDAVVKDYVRKVLAGLWIAGVAEIAISQNNVIINGQHTLWAVFNSGQAIWVKITKGLSPEAVLAWDQSRARSAAQSYALSCGGSAAKVRENTQRAALATAIVKVVTGNNKAASDEIKEFDDRHGRGISWILSMPHGTKASGFNAKMVRGALALAYESAPHKIEEMARQAITGVGEFPEGSPARALQMVALPGTFNEGTSGRREQAMKVLRVCQAVLRGEDILSVRVRPDTLETFTAKFGYGKKVAKVVAAVPPKLRRAS